jgi:hypothetical protein
MVPAGQVESALSELGLDARAIYELGGWKSTEDNVATAFGSALDDQ